MAHGVAALPVMFGHLRSFVFVSYAELERHSSVDAIVWAVTGLWASISADFFRAERLQRQS